MPSLPANFGWRGTHSWYGLGRGEVGKDDHYAHIHTHKTKQNETHMCVSPPEVKL